MCTLPEPEQARRAIRTFKDEYLLDFINIEDGMGINGMTGYSTIVTVTRTV